MLRVTAFDVIRWADYVGHHSGTARYTPKLWPCGGMFTYYRTLSESPYAASMSHSSSDAYRRGARLTNMQKLAY